MTDDKSTSTEDKNEQLYDYCPQGHPFDEHNRGVKPPDKYHKNGSRRCKACANDYNKKYKSTHDMTPTAASKARRQEYNRQHREERKAYNLAYRQIKGSEIKAQRQEYYKKNKVKVSAKKKIASEIVKDTVFTYYGNVCACCGETNRAFFSIDHVNNDGAKHRSEAGVGGGVQLYRWLIRNNFPDGFQLLCFNCNCAKQYNGICPHQLE